MRGLGVGRRLLSVAARPSAEELQVLRQDRAAMETDVLVVGAGPAGLAAAIRLKQLNPGRAVVVLEKAAEIGRPAGIGCC